jgi:hypothetical protein
MNGQDFPALYGAANQLSLDAQNHFFKVLFINLCALVCAAALSVFNLPYVGIAYAQVFVLLISLGCTVYLGAIRPEKLWYGGRALAESVKTITWRYMMRAEPYNMPDSDARSLFIDVLRRLVDSNKEVSKQTIDVGTGIQISDFMTSIRDAPFVARKEYYKDKRISDQMEWYQGKASINNRRARQYFIGLCVVNIIAIVFAIVKISCPSAQFWPTDIFVALAASVMAWTQAKRFRELSASYALTAHEISLIREQLFHIFSEAKFSDFIGDAENAFSREHTQWIARRDV